MTSDHFERTDEIEVAVLGENSTYIRRTDEQIKQLAIGALGGGIFGSWMVHESDKNLLTSIFMPLVFMTPIEVKALQRDGVVEMFEVISEAGPRSINGYPVFFSVQFLDEQDRTRLFEKIEQIRNI